MVFANVVNPNGFKNIIFRNVVKPMVLATLCLDILKNYWFLSFRTCCKTNGFSNTIVDNVVKPMVLATLLSKMM